MAAINPNDERYYAEDSFEHMQALAKEQGFTFPYLHDVSQEVAASYEAVCTPDYFGFDAQLRLQYRGRLEDLLTAMKQVAASGSTDIAQVPSIGCSIKWNDKAA